MAEVEAAIFNLLSANAGVSALVASRIYPEILPQPPTYPALTYRRMSFESVEVLDGTAAGLDHPRIEVNSWATTYAGALTLNAAVRTALRRVTDLTQDPDILDAILENEFDMYEDDVKVYRRVAEYVVWHR